jgi:hypothetical protein
MVSILKKIRLLILPEHRRIYAVVQGTYKGEWLVRISRDNESGVYVSLPDLYKRIIPNKDFEWGLSNKVLEPVDVLPKNIYNTCIANAKLAPAAPTNDTRNNRRKQHSTPDTLGSK